MAAGSIVQMMAQNLEKLGLKTSEHIGRIALDPKDSNTVYVLRRDHSGGRWCDRGLYKPPTAARPEKDPDISENTGVTDVVIDPQNPRRFMPRRINDAGTCGR